MTRPLVLIAWDAAEPAVLERGMREGWMPTLRALRARGRAYALAGSQHEFPGAVWPNTTTGFDVSVHGVYMDKQLVPGTYRVEQRSSGDIGPPPFWRYVSDAGIASVVAGMYAGPLLPDFRGIQAAGWGTPDPYWTGSRPGIEPAEWRQRILGEVGPRDLKLPKLPETHEELRAYRDRVVSGVGEQARGLELLMRDAEWGLFCGGIGEPHQAGHMMWHTYDADAPEHAEMPEDLRDAIPALYRALDGTLARLLEAMPAEARILLLSPHGMGAQRMSSDPLPTILERGGWLVRRRGVDRPTGKRMAKALWRLGKRLTTRRMRILLGRVLPRDRWYLSLLHTDADWPRTRAFTLIADHLSYLRGNVLGREPQGIVPPQELGALCEEIGEALSALEDPDTGRPAVEDLERFWSRSGKMAELPDLGVRWATTRATRRLRSDALGTIEISRDDERTGMHVLPGFLLAAGPGIEPDGGRGMGGPGISALDVAPTVLGSLGVPVPTELPGRRVPGL